MSELAAKEAIELKKVTVLDIPMLKIVRDFYVITRKGVSVSPQAAAVLAVMKRVLK